MSEAEAPQSHVERRAQERVPTTLRGKTFPGPLDCVVKDFTEKGAKLRFEAVPPPGDKLVLVMWTTGMAFEAQVRWRAGAEIGVRFLQRCDFRARTPQMFWPMRAEWLKSRRPMRRKALIRDSAMIMKAPRRGRPDARE
jgi:hypothetical protein